MSMMSSSVGSHSTLHASLAYEFLLSEFLLRVTKTEKENLSHRDQKFRNIDRRILAIKITWRIVNRFEGRVLASLNIMGKEGGGGRVR